MAENTVFSGANTGYVPTLSWPDASGQLVVSFAKNPKLFAVNRYTQIITVEKQQGKYARLNPFDQSRTVSSTGADSVWADSADRPINTQLGFTYPEYSTQRYSKNFILGKLAIDQSQWDIVAASAAMAAQQMMLLHTYGAQTAIQAAGVLTTSTATALSGGKWNAGNNTAAANQYFRLGVQQVLAAIALASNDVVQPMDVCMIMNPNTARGLSQSTEIVDFVKQSMQTGQNLTLDATFSRWGMPPTLFGVGEVIVDAAVATTTKAGKNAQTQAFVVPDGVVEFVSRPGMLEAQASETYSTVMGVFYENMTVETIADAFNRKTTGGVTSDFQYVISAPQTGYLITAAI